MRSPVRGRDCGGNAQTIIASLHRPEPDAVLYAAPVRLTDKSYEPSKPTRTSTRAMTAQEKWFTFPDETGGSPNTKPQLVTSTRALADCPCTARHPILRPRGKRNPRLLLLADRSTIPLGVWAWALHSDHDGARARRRFAITVAFIGSLLSRRSVYVQPQYLFDSDFDPAPDAPPDWEDGDQSGHTHTYKDACDDVTYHLGPTRCCSRPTAGARPSPCRPSPEA